MPRPWLLPLLLLAAPAASAAPPDTATPPESLKVAKGFAVELLYSVPRNEQGSWVNLCADPKGRLIVSDQYGKLYRVTPAPVGQKGAGTRVETVPAPIGAAQGMVWAFDALYVVVNDTKLTPGLYRVTDSDGDDQLDKVELLRDLKDGGREHGPHAVLKHPDGKRLTVVCGNQTRLTECDTSLVPRVWGDDHLLPRLPDGNGFMKGVLAPGGWIANCDPNGKNWELVSVGFRNQYDAGYNRDGELFTYDADMEWDYNTPWYRPTRVCHVVPGSDWGWRNGAGKYPTYYADTLPPVVNIGPGSPTGTCFGYGAKFPAKYQDAFFICDWSYGKLYAVHLKAKGASYEGTFEEYVTGTPLPLTDVIVSPTDGAMYFTTGGRKTQSGLYRVTYTGNDVAGEVHTATSVSDAGDRLTNALRNIGAADRFVRFHARTALEEAPPAKWRDRVLGFSEPTALIHGVLALVRASAPCPEHRRPSEPPVDPKLRQECLFALGKLDWKSLSEEQRLDLVRTLQVLLHRLGPPTERQTAAITERLEAVYPTGSRFLDGMLCETLVFLQSPDVAAKTMKLLAEAPTQEEQIEYVRSLRVLKAGWTPELKRAYFEWFGKASYYKGGNSFQGFVRLIKADAVALLTPEEKVALAPVLAEQPRAVGAVAPPRPFVKKWALADLAPKLQAGLAGGRDFDRGRKLFAAATCFACHRYGDEGGSAGPDLSGVAGRFAPRDLLESIVDPSKEVSDQYGAVEIDTLDGRKVVGRIVNLKGDDWLVNTDMLNPAGIVTVKRADVESVRPSKLSMMPAGLLDTLKEDEVLDLLAYVLSRGDRKAAQFQK